MLTTTLDRSSGIYAQEETASGQVSFQHSSPVYVYVQMCGRAETTVYEYNSYGETDLFCTQIGEASGCEIGLPIAFAFPARASPIDPYDVDMRYWTEHIMTIRSNHLLPPTFYHDNPKFSASVEFLIKASVWSSGRSQRRLAEKIVPIVYRRMIETRFPQKMSIS